MTTLRPRWWLCAVPLMALAAPATAQMHDMKGMEGMTMPHMAMPAPKPAARPKPRTQKPDRRTPAAAAVACLPEHAAMGHCKAAAPATPPPKPSLSTPSMPMTIAGSAPCPPEHAAMGHCTAAPSPATTADAGPVGTDQAAGDATPPAPPTDLAAARFYDPAAIAGARRAMQDEHGGMRFGQIRFNLAEVDVRRGRDGYRWDGAGWFGGDIDRLVVKSEGEGGFGDRVEAAEVQALYARAIDPYWNVQAGVRQDLAGGARRTYAVVGVEGLAPYWFDVEGAVFVSDKGVRARAEAWYDQRITQRAILQPRLEVNLAAQDEADARVGAGLSDVELGLRLRYEITREFAPYVGLSWARRYGTTARYARADGEATGGLALAVGVRGWL